MKTAQDVAEAIHNFMVNPISGTPEEMLHFELEFIAQALTEYADEKVKEARQEELNKRILIAQAEIDRHRDIAIEECAKVADEEYWQGGDDEEGSGVCRASGNIAHAIRALKKEPSC